MLAACRYEFAELHDAAIPQDAPPAPLACNTPVRLGDAGGGIELAATATATRVLAVWIDEAGAIHAGGATIAAQVASPFATEVQPGPFVHVAIAADTTGANVIGVATDATGASGLRIADDATLTYGDAIPSTIALTGSHGLAATGLDAPRWVLAGNDSVTMRELATGITVAGELAPALDSGVFGARTTLVPFGARIALVDQSAGDACRIRTMPPDVTSLATASTWGTTGQCTEPIGLFSPGNPGVLLVRHDLTDDDLNHVVATLTATGTLTIPGESRLRNPADEPRGVGVADGYWVAYETGGSLEVVHVDLAGTVATPIVLGPVPAATTHDLVLFGGEPYAIWLAGGLELARICS